MKRLIKAVWAASLLCAPHSASAATSSRPDDSGIVYSPYNWNVSRSGAKTINAGAYFRTLFSGSGMTLNFSIDALAAPLPEIAYRVDGFGPWITEKVAPSLAITVPPETSAYPRHLLEVRVKSTTETKPRWNATANVVTLTGLQAAGSGKLAAPGKAALSLLIYGDSITEGVRTVSGTATDDTDRNDSGQGWALELGRLLGAEVGVVGFGAQGWNAGGSGGVPALPVAYNYVYAGVRRTFSPAPDAVIVNMGANDLNRNTTTSVTTFLNGLLSAVPAARKIILLRPFNGPSQAAFLQAGIAGSSDPARVSYVDTNGMFDKSDSFDGLHPYGYANLALIAPALAAAIRPLLIPQPAAPGSR